MKLFEIKIDYHKTLNPKLWDGLKLKSEVKRKLKETANAICDSIDVPMDIKDILFIGSNANYNWTPLSDIDLHVIIDLDKFKKACADFTEDYFLDKKTLFNEHHDIMIYGFPVEVYIEGDHPESPEIAIYSLKTDKWIKKPIYNLPQFNSDEVDRQTAEWKKKLNQMIKSANIGKMEKFGDKIHDIRKKSIAKDGEFSDKNLAYKQLRKDGDLEKLRDAKRDTLTKELSLK